MATAQAKLTPTVDDFNDDLDEDIVEEGNWTEDRKEILKNLTWEDIEAEAERLEAEYPGRFKTPEEIHAKIMRLQEEQTTGRRLEMAEA